MDIVRKCTNTNTNAQIHHACAYPERGGGGGGRVDKIENSFEKFKISRICLILQSTFALLSGRGCPMPTDRHALLRESHFLAPADIGKVHS